MNYLAKGKYENTENRIIKDTRSHFRLKKGKEATKDYIYKKKIVTIRDNLREELLEQEEDYYNSVRVGNFWSNNCVEYESVVIKIKPCQLKNILIKIDHT